MVNPIEETRGHDDQRRPLTPQRIDELLKYLDPHTSVYWRLKSLKNDLIAGRVTP